VASPDTNTAVSTTQDVASAFVAPTTTTATTTGTTATIASTTPTVPINPYRALQLQYDTQRVAIDQ
jgi:hypothetical protein